MEIELFVFCVMFATTKYKYNVDWDLNRPLKTLMIPHEFYFWKKLCKAIYFLKWNSFAHKINTTPVIF